MALTRAVAFGSTTEAALLPLDMPSPGPGEVLVRTRHSTVSAGTEGWVWGDRFTWSRTPYPCVPGYQRSGIVQAVGDGVTDWQVGDAVMATTGCWTGDLPPFWGSHAGLALTRATELYRLPDGCDPVDASAAVTAQVGYNAASRLVLAPGDWVVVYGDGLIGQFGAQAARARGARVCLVGHRAERLERATAAGIDAIVNRRDDEAPAAIRAVCGDAIAAVIDTVQVEDVGREYVPLLPHGRGQVVFSGFTPGTTWADMALLQQHELTCHFVSGWSRERMDATLAALADGRMSYRALLTHHVPPPEAPACYQMVRGKLGPFLGITIDWTGDEA